MRAFGVIGLACRFGNLRTDVALRAASLFAGVGGWRIIPVEVLMPRGSKPKVYPADMVAKVEKLYHKGMTQREVARELETTQRVIWRLMYRHGIQARSAVKRDQYGEKNSSWKGADAGYQALHLRVQALRGKPRKCESCGTTDKRKSYDWANISGEYDNPGDYKRMCRSCHWKLDGTINNIKRMNGREVAGENE